MNQSPPVTQYLLAGDTSLAYQVLGEGPPVLVVNGFVSHLECMWEEPGLADFLWRLAQQCTLILFDERGVGLSERLNEIPRAEDTLGDMLALVRHLDLEKVSLFAVSEGGPAAMMFSATYPQKVDRLLLYGTLPKWIRSYDFPWSLSRSQYDEWLESMVASWGEAVSLQYFAPSRRDDADFCTWWAKTLMYSHSPRSLRAILQAMRDIDVRDCLEHVRAPTLILHKTLDRAVRIEGGRFLKSRIPGARLMELSGTDHWWWTEPGVDLVPPMLAFLNSGSGDEAHSDAGAIVLHEQLTARETEILQLIAAGHGNQAVADSLHLSLGTVKTYTSTIYAKLQVRNRAQAVLAARRAGVLD